MKLFLVFLILLISFSISAQQEKVFLNNCIHDYISKTKNRVFEPDNENLFRSIIDLNNDGLNDLLISGFQSGDWGNAGGNWKIYFQKPNGSFEKCSEELFMHPLATYFDSMKNKFLLYRRLGSSEGLIMNYVFENYYLKFLDSMKINNKSSVAQSEEIDLIISKNPRLKKIQFELSKFTEIDKMVWE
ncbi:VCBS repeat-containing protein [Polaribacter sp. Hel_I_88]|uniref:VCBS repeat-containing protein n=1 Tax=Polaribacter sp. Hel_I_88 TaxID=1250006 RepID=UPI00047E75EC|nr:VCBS repeat-containing protein [Polaribacter sp. Hel_I_88]